MNIAAIRLKCFRNFDGVQDIEMVRFGREAAVVEIDGEVEKKS